MDERTLDGYCWRPRIPKPMKGDAEACDVGKKAGYTYCSECTWWRNEE